MCQILMVIYFLYHKMKILQPKQVMKILLPPSEGKKIWWTVWKTTINTELPFSIAKNATSKDLKCTWKRYEEWITLNCSVNDWPVMSAIERYTWVMFWAIDYDHLSPSWKDYFNEHIFIISWMYWLISPLDMIANYKLPIDTKWLREFWWDHFTQQLLWTESIIDLLPQAHKKMIDFKLLEERWTVIVHCDFFHENKKLSHWVKWVKWYRLSLIAEQWSTDYAERPTAFTYKWKSIVVQYS